MKNSVLKIGVVGMGGYARHVTDGLLNYAEAHPGTVQFSGACDPDLTLHAARAKSLESQGVRVVNDIDALLKLPLDAVWLPVPIDLHRPFTDKALAAGKAVIVEKPAAGYIGDVDEMVAARDRAKLPVAVGFQNLFDPAAWSAKRKLLAGLIGKPKRASVYASWPRGDVYYQRNKWAGKLKHNETWVLDSPANNAMAHFLNLALFLLGPTERDSAVPVAVEAELYRANPIENYDTCTIRYDLPGGVPLLLALTHACETQEHPLITIEGDAGTLEFAHADDYEFRPANGEATTIPSAANMTAATVHGFIAYLNGDPKAEYASLENARAHALAISAASQASRVQTIPADAIQTKPGEGGKPLHYVPGIDAAMQHCATTGQLLSQLGRWDWAKPAKRVELSQLKTFTLP